jgi:uncharacterized repeat protein (TIGR03803 family)
MKLYQRIACTRVINHLFSKRQVKKASATQANFSTQDLIRASPWALVAVLALISLKATSWASTETVLYRFGSGGAGDGKEVPAGLVADSSGNYYGITELGGSAGNGTVFELSPVPGGTWNKTTLYSFGNFPDGSQPIGSLIFDTLGNLYGTTSIGGSSNNGTVFKLAFNGSTWTETVLYSFAGTSSSDGSLPTSSLTIDSSGNLYGTTLVGGSGCDAYGCGTVYELAPAGGASWTETVLHKFNKTDGKDPDAGVVLDGSGNLYGTTEDGGAHDRGTVFKLDTSGTLTTLHSFALSSDGQYPVSNLTWDSVGNLYGTTFGGGADYDGTVFELSLGSGGAWTESILYSFTATGDGDSPIAGVVFDRSGNIYGTTSGYVSSGTAFKLAPGAGSWSETTLHVFPGSGGPTSTDGRQPQSTLLVEGSGTLYGTTAFGGGIATCNAAGAGSGCGVIFEITP